MFKVSDLSSEIFENTTSIYRLYSNGVVVYVGQSRNLAGRIATHISNKEKDFDSFDFTECKEKEMNALEADEIVKHKPIYNATLPSNDKYIALGKLKDLYPDVALIVHDNIEPDFESGDKGKRLPNCKSKHKYYEAERVEAIAKTLRAACKNALLDMGEMIED